MAQVQTTVPIKSNTPPNNTIHDRPEEINNLNETINLNSEDFELREQPISEGSDDNKDRLKIIEDTDTSNIKSYATNDLPTDLTDGTVAFDKSMEVPVFSLTGEWCRVSDNTPLNNLIEVDLFIVMGQSNADGFSQFSNLDSLTGRTLESLDRSDILMYTSSADPTGGWVQDYADWSPIDPGVNTAQNSDRFGPELGFADTIKAIVDGGGNPTFSNPIAIMKHAKENTSLGGDWADPSGFVYQPMTKAIPDSKFTLGQDGYKFNIRGMIWYQGENDAADLNYSTNYEGNLNGLILDLRTRFKTPDLPVIICKIGFTSGQPTYYTEVRDAQQAVADSDSSIKTIDASLYDFRDIVHLNAKGMYELGEAIVPLMTTLL